MVGCRDPLHRPPQHSNHDHHGILLSSLALCVSPSPLLSRSAGTILIREPVLWQDRQPRDHAAARTEPGTCGTLEIYGMGMKWKFGRGPGWEKHLAELTLSTLNLILGLGRACGSPWVSQALGECSLCDLGRPRVSLRGSGSGVGLVFWSWNADMGQMKETSQAMKKCLWVETLGCK